MKLFTLFCTFAPDMYTLNEYLPIFVGDDLPEKGWDSGMYCLETDRAKILRSNLLRGFDFMVILEGKTMREVAYFVAQKLAPIDAVMSTATHFVLRKYKDKGVVYGPQEVDERGNNL